MSRIWFITGATRGIGAEIAKAEAVEAALGVSEGMLAVTLDVTKPGQPEEAVKAAIDRFSGIDRGFPLYSGRAVSPTTSVRGSPFSVPMVSGVSSG